MAGSLMAPVLRVWDGAALSARAPQQVALGCALPMGGKCVAFGGAGAAAGASFDPCGASGLKASQTAGNSSGWRPSAETVVHRLALKKKLSSARSATSAGAGYQAGGEAATSEVFAALGDGSDRTSVSVRVLRDDVWVPVRMEYPPATVGALWARDGFATCTDGQSRVMLFGGAGRKVDDPECKTGGMADALWYASLSMESDDVVTGRWMQFLVDAAPPRRRHAAIAAVGKHAFLVHGGVGVDGCVLSDAWIFRVPKGVGARGPWRQLDVLGDVSPAQLARAHHTLIVAGDRLLVFGGTRASTLAGCAGDPEELVSAIPVLEVNRDTLAAMTASLAPVRGKAEAERIADVCRVAKKKGGRKGRTVDAARLAVLEDWRPSVPAASAACALQAATVGFKVDAKGVVTVTTPLARTICDAVWALHGVREADFEDEVEDSQDMDAAKRRREERVRARGVLTQGFGGVIFIMTLGGVVCAKGAGGAAPPALTSDVHVVLVHKAGEPPSLPPLLTGNKGTSAAAGGASAGAGALPVADRGKAVTALSVHAAMYGSSACSSPFLARSVPAGGSNAKAASGARQGRVGSSLSRELAKRSSSLRPFKVSLPSGPGIPSSLPVPLPASLPFVFPVLMPSLAAAIPGAPAAGSPVRQRSSIDDALTQHVTMKKSLRSQEKAPAPQVEARRSADEGAGKRAAEIKRDVDAAAMPMVAAVAAPAGRAAAAAPKAAAVASPPNPNRKRGRSETAPGAAVKATKTVEEEEDDYGPISHRRPPRRERAGGTVPVERAAPAARVAPVVRAPVPPPPPPAEPRARQPKPASPRAVVPAPRTSKRKVEEDVVEAPPPKRAAAVKELDLAGRLQLAVEENATLEVRCAKLEARLTSTDARTTAEVVEARKSAWDLKQAGDKMIKALKAENAKVAAAHTRAMDEAEAAATESAARERAGREKRERDLEFKVHAELQRRKRAEAENRRLEARCEELEGSVNGKATKLNGLRALLLQPTQE